MMKYLIVVPSILVSLFGTLKAETKEEIMNILAKKLEIIDSNNDFPDEETKVRQAEFLKKHQQLIDSLGKDEIFYHLELTSDLFNESRPGFQPPAAYALYLYSKFHDEYSREESEVIANKIRGFAEKGWIPEEDFKRFESIHSQQKTNSSASPRESPGSSDKTSTPSFESRPNDKPQESTTPKISAEQTSKSAETEHQSSSTR